MLNDQCGWLIISYFIGQPGSLSQVKMSIPYYQQHLGIGDPLFEFAYISLSKRPQMSNSHVLENEEKLSRQVATGPPMLVSGDLTSNIRRPNSKQETKERQTARPPIHVSSLNRSRSGGHFRSILGHHFGPEDPLEPSSSLVSPHDYCLTPPPKRLTTLLRL